MSYFISSPRVGRSQGASLFWGLISVCFAAAACFYFWRDHETERNANVAREQVMQLREENESLNSQKEHLQAARAEAESQLKTREDLVSEKETQLAAEETKIESLGNVTQSQTAQNLAQVTMVNKFNDAIRKLDKSTNSDVVERGGRPVLRLPADNLFATGDAVLKPEGKALLNQLAVAIDGQMDTFELRVVCYTDSDAEAAPPAKDDNGTPADIKPKFTSSWDLTAARAAALGHYYRDQTSLPFLDVTVSGRGDSEPIVSNSKDGHARNRRVEITVTPLPIAFHPPDTDKTATPDKTTKPPKPPKTTASTGSTTTTGTTTGTGSTTTTTPKKTDKNFGH